MSRVITSSISWCAVALAICLRLAGVANAEYAALTGEDVQVGIGHFESEGVGFDRGFTSFEAFWPAFDEEGTSAALFDYRFIVTNEGDEWHNAGLGYRTYIEGIDLILGGYVYYDARNTSFSKFQQVSAGLEFIGDRIEANLNGYFPVTDKRRFTGEVAFAGFNMVGLVEAAMTGMDSEIGFRLPYLENVKLFAGGYGYEVFGSDDAVGGRGRLELQITENVTAGVAVQNDRVFDTTVTASVAVRFGRTARRSARPANTLDRLAQPIRRNYNIVIVRQRELLINPATGAPWTVLHVDNSAPAGGTGSFEMPLDALPANPGLDIVFVYQSGADYSTTGVTLADQQRFFGQGLAYWLDGQWDQFRMPGFRPGAAPVLDGGGLADVLVLANNNEVAGITIQNGQNGITGTGVNSATIHDVTVQGQTQNGVVLSAAAGTFALDNVVLENNGADGLRVAASDLVLTVRSSRIAGNGSAAADQGIDVVDSIGTFTFSDLTVVDNASGGLRVNNTGVAGLVSVAVTDSTFRDNANSTGLLTDEADVVFGGDGDYALTATGNSFVGGSDIDVGQNSDVGILADLAVGARFIATIENNQFQDVNYSALYLRMQPGASSELGVSILNNTITRSGRGGVGDALVIRNEADNTGTLAIRDNVITNAPGNGVHIQALGASTSSLEVVGNTVDTVTLDGVDVEAGAGATINLSGSGNTFTNISGVDVNLHGAGTINGSITP